ncbi:hypothetical protein EYF80_044405 [Liparis tanakae]|uniref:Uncharacterized protein n=1 Tax=Liparis tanakae TaxID=230148 RepID=A0A4Z2FXW9_9TELE|nr:hypothetical protein EYF80_044405 [Liparis tanakae]
MPWPMDQANHAPSGEKSTLHVSQPARPSRDGGRRVFSSSTRAGSAAGRGRHGVSGGSRTRIRVRLRLTSRRDDVILDGIRWIWTSVVWLASGASRGTASWKIWSSSDSTRLSTSPRSSSTRLEGQKHHADNKEEP